MKFAFCPECLAPYRALVYDPQAGYAPNLIPFGCIIWSDEHRPMSNCETLIMHQECRHALIVLTSARKLLWRTGQIPREYQQLWLEAQTLMPNWPGFRRLTLTAQQLRDLDACEEETGDLVAQVRRDASMFVLEDRGDGVVRFIAHPPAPRPGDDQSQFENK